MQRMILRTITVMSVMCLCYLIPFQVLGNASDYGPEMDPVISDESENISLTCPPPTTIDCDDNGIYMTYAEFQAAGGSANLSDGCEVDSFTFVADTQVSQNGCSFVYMREYFILGTCGNTFTCNQIIMLTDDDDPMILNCPSDTTLMVSTTPCTVSYTVPDIDTFDGCSDVTVSNDITNPLPVGETLVTITATDECGNSSQCTYTVTVENNNMLTVVCPSGIMDNTVCDISEIPPYADFAAFMSAGGSASGSCSSMSTIFTISNINDIPVGGSCPKTVNRTYTISDDEGNEGSCTQLITIIDDTDPTFTVPMDAIGVECSMALDTSVTGSPSNIMDNCDSIFVVTFADSDTILGACVGEYSFTRTWTVTDQCSNEAQETQTISTVDTTPPTAVCKDTFIIFLDISGDGPIIPDSLDNGSSDLCSGVSFSANMDFASCNQVNSPTEVILTVADSCGNMANCNVVLIVLDTMSIILTAPANDTISCIGDLDPPYADITAFVADGGMENDNCPANSTFELIESDSTGVCPIIVTRIYQYTDFSNNSDTALHTIYVIDDEAPVISACPVDITITETEICDTLLVFGLPTVTDNCGDVTIINNYTNNTDSMATFSGGTTEIMFIATDACGNSDTCTMTVTLAADPKITCPPMGIIDSEDDLPDYVDLQAFLDAGGMVNMFCAIDDTTFMYSNTFVLDVDSCSATITEMVSINDTLGNPIIANKAYTAMDTLNPEISPVSNQFVPLIHETCQIDTTFSLPTATDNFGVDTTYFTIGVFVEDTAQVVFYAEDFCGNIDSFEYKLILYDPTSPDIEIDSTTIMCDSVGAAPIYNTLEEFLAAPGAYVYDCRLDSTSFSYDGETIDINGNIVHTYSIEDFSGQSATVPHVITIIDSTDPEITMCTDDIAINAESDTCGATIMVPDPEYMDNCNGTIILTNDYNGTDDASDFYPVGVTTVVWTIEDETGMTDTCSFTVTITDTTVPSIVCPSDTMITCEIGNYPAFITIPDFIAGGGLASDNCDLASISSTTLLSSPNEYERTYTLTDVNGLDSFCVQTINVIDTIAPMIMCDTILVVDAEELSCDKFIDVTPPTATDDCDDNPEITNNINGMSTLSGTFSGTTSVTWYAEDDFGNIDSCTYDIVVVDNTDPVASVPDTMIMCEAMLASIDTFMSVQDIIDADGSATDNCGIEFVNFISQSAIVNDTIKREYEVIDSTGNTISLIHCIIIDDTTPPTFAAPDNVTVNCDADINDLAITGTVDSNMLSDNCMDIDTLIYTDNVDQGVCPFINEITRIWILTDNSGNEARDTQMISTIDTVPPVFDPIPDNLSNINCDDDFPPMQMVNANDDCSGALVLTDTLPYLENICAGYDVTYRWIAVDGCQNRDTITRTFSVNPDNTPPMLVSANDTIVNSEGDICGIRVDNVLGPIFEEDCSLITYTNNFLDTIYPVGTTNVLWTAMNDCGGEDTVTQVIIVLDSIPPVVLCKNATAGITMDPQNNVPASSFIVSANDNCGIDSMLVSRLTEGCGIMDIGTFKDSILICCDDVGTTVDVMIKVVDESGNINFCNATLEVQDNRAPLVLAPLPNILISCSYVFDTLDLDVFGTFTMDPDGREDIIIEDTLYADQDSIAGIDGLISDECMVTIKDSTVVNLDICNNGTITRIFTFTDGSGNTETSEQIIQIQDVSPFNENGNDIIWPVNFVWDQCGTPAPDTSISGAPIFENLDKCALVAANFKDQLFNFPTTSCPFIKRKWQVIDWCQYDEDVMPNPGLWTYNQYIFVENTVPPTIISGCSDTLICAPFNECSAVVSLGIEAEDDCEADSEFMFYEYTININSDNNTGNDISGKTSSFSEEIESGIHEVTWTVEDRCGNESTCSYILTVKECKAPTAVCLTGLIIVIDQTGEAALWASDVNQSSSDNCTDQDDLIFSFSSDVEDFGVVFDCDDVGITQNIEMWVTDLEGNQSFCSTFVDVQDNNGYCNNIIGNEDPTSLQGKIATESNSTIPEAMVSIYGAEMDDEFMTDDDGEYAFDDINIENDYQVKVERDKDDIEGVSTLDLVMIQRHILGLDPLDSPYKLIAADINNNEKITASDLVALRKLILGIDATFPDNKSWRFVSMDKEMADMSNPWPFDEDLIVGSVPLQNVEADFIGVKIGDVNNTIDNLIGTEAIETRNENSFGIVTRDQKVHRDDEVLVDFVCATSTSLEALQMTIEWDKSAMNFVDIIPIGIQIEDGFINKSQVNEGVITIAWTSVESKMIQEGMPIFQLIFEGNETSTLSKNLMITSKMTKALAYDSDDVEHNLELRFIEGQTEGMMLMQNKPNPFVSETVVEFALPESMEVTFKVFNGAGSLIHKDTRTYTEGMNSFKLNDELKDHKGLLFLKMETAEFSEVKRMIRID